MWMYMGNLSLRTFFNIFFFIWKFSNFRICSNLVGFNRINSIEFLLNVQNQLILNTYWATSSPISEVSMLPYTIVGDGGSGAHYWILKHTNFWFGRDGVQKRVLVLPTPIFQYQKENHVWWVMAYSLASLARTEEMLLFLLVESFLA